MKLGLQANERKGSDTTMAIKIKVTYGRGAKTPIFVVVCTTCAAVLGQTEIIGEARTMKCTSCSREVIHL